jgi:hypothetical protein
MFREFGNGVNPGVGIVGVILGKELNNVKLQ